MTEPFVGRIDEDSQDVSNSNMIRWISNNSIEFSISYDPHKGDYDTIEGYLTRLEDLAGGDVKDVEHLFPANHLWEIRVWPYTPTMHHIIRAANLRQALVETVKALKEYWLNRGCTLKTAPQLKGKHRRDDV